MKLELRSHNFPVWQGTVSLEKTDDWIKPWRIPYESRNLFYHQLCIRAAMPAGVRIIFRSDTSYIEGKIEPQLEESQIDLYCDEIFIKSISLKQKDKFVFSDLANVDKLIELWLPQKGELKLKALEIADDASFTTVEDNRPRWITYGSSITQCSAAESPSQTWPAIVARKSGLNLTCLGFGGQCHLDPIIAQLIRDLPADFISICAGINIYGSASLSPRSFRQALIGTIQTIREKHTNIPIVLISPIYSPPREKTENAVGFTLEDMRIEVATAVEDLMDHGDQKLYYVEGLQIFGIDLVEMLPDQLHPNSEGYKALAEKFIQQIVNKFFIAQ